MGLFEDALATWGEAAEFGGLLDAIRRGLRDVEWAGLPPPAALTLALSARRALGRPLVLLCPDWPSAQAAVEAAAVWCRGEDGPLFFPPRDFLPYAVVAQSPEVHARRLSTMAALTAAAAQRSGPPPVVVLPAAALRRQLPPPDVFANAVISLEVGRPGDPSRLAAELSRAGYERQPVVEGPGTFALRGGIVDVFPLPSADPVRIEFDGDAVCSLRTFSADSQRSEAPLEVLSVPPAREVPCPQGDGAQRALSAVRGSLEAMERRYTDAQAEARLRLGEQVGADLEALEAGASPGLWETYLPFAYAPTSILTYLASAWPGVRPICAVLGGNATVETLAELQRQEAERLAGFLAEGRVLPEQAHAFGMPGDWQADLARGTAVYFDSLGLSGVRAQEQLQVAGRSAPPFAGQWSLALDTIRRWQQGRYRVVCFASTPERADRLAAEFRDAAIPCAADPDGTAALVRGEVHVTCGELPAGFEVPALRLAVLGESELHGRRPRPARVRRGGGAGARLQSYEDLRVGDFVVHTAHGVGQYLGTAALTVQGKVRDYLVLRYEGTDRLYVPTDQVGLVQKYIGGEARAPRLSRLGGAEWSRAKQRVRESVRHMAAELLALYAARQALNGHAFPSDGPWHTEFAQAFPYEETPDQLHAIAEITADMERPVPMDRLLCGDVGYGKTEVAMRAAFKSVADGRQVAILVPTTILAEQHYLTFTERFRDFPVQIRMLSRFRSRKEQEETITALRRGGVDIVIGTHRLLQDDLDFKALGLLVVDEEHRFGVAAKERLKQMRKTVDVLTMTATPIPRTLHMALSGIRDMSVINTPPDNRYPVETMVVEWTPTLVREALHRELQRGGQVYYLHNRVQSIGLAHERVRELVGDADVVVAHGQMPEDELERVMTEFWRGQHQVLLATTIIESGLDIPNANTVIVEDADRLGLAQLYQVRGRVGRSSRVAYAYFTYRRQKSLTEVASKRLEAVKEFTELGSGFRIALRDLEIRGAGNLLGPEQHGFVAAVGFEMYAQLLEEAVREMRGEREVPAARVTVELSVDGFMDDAYVAEPRVKLEFYKRVNGAASAEELQATEAELRDRFGPYPAGVGNLLRLARIRLMAQDLGLIGVVQDARTVTFGFAPYWSPLFTRLQDLTARFGRRLRLQASPKPQVRLHLDGTDDATVLASVESCLHALAAHPAVRAWRRQLAAAVNGGEDPDADAMEVHIEGAPDPVLPEAASGDAVAARGGITPAPAARVPAPPAAVGAARPAAPAVPAAQRSRGMQPRAPAREDRLAKAHGWAVVGHPPARPAARPPARKGPVRAVAPPGLVLPGGAAARPPRRPRRG